MKSAHLHLLIALLMGACGGADKKVVEKPAAKDGAAATPAAPVNTPKTEKPAVMAIGAATLGAPGATIEIDSSGQIKANGKAVGQVHADGRFADPSGKTLATLAADGSIATGDGQALKSLHISAEGVLQVAGKTVTIGKDGFLNGGGLGGRELRVSAEPKVRRMAMYILVLAALSTATTGPPAGVTNEQSKPAR